MVCRACEVVFDRDKMAEGEEVLLAVDAGGCGVPLGAGWCREVVVNSLVFGASAATNPLPSTMKASRKISRS